MLESIDMKLETCNCKLYHVLVFLDHCSYSYIFVTLFMADDLEDPLGLEMHKAICSVAYPEHIAELSSWGYCNCCYNLDPCQWASTAYFVQLR